LFFSVDDEHPANRLIIKIVIDNMQLFFIEVILEDLQYRGLVGIAQDGF